MKLELELLQTTKCPQSLSKFAITVPLPKLLFSGHQPHRKVTSSTKANLEVPIPVAARSKAASFLGLRFRIPSKSLMSLCCDCCVLTGSGSCDGLITRLKETYLVWSV